MGLEIDLEVRSREMERSQEGLPMAVGMAVETKHHHRSRAAVVVDNAAAADDAVVIAEDHIRCCCESRGHTLVMP